MLLLVSTESIQVRPASRQSCAVDLRLPAPNAAASPWYSTLSQVERASPRLAQTALAPRRRQPATPVVIASPSGGSCYSCCCLPKAVLARAPESSSPVRSSEVSFPSAQVRPVSLPCFACSPLLFLSCRRPRFLTIFAHPRQKAPSLPFLPASSASANASCTSIGLPAGRLEEANKPGELLPFHHAHRLSVAI